MSELERLLYGQGYQAPRTDADNVLARMRRPNPITEDDDLPDQVRRLMREPYPSEMGYLKANPHVAGMATEDDRVVLNPLSQIGRDGHRSVAINEAARVQMRDPRFAPPSFDLTPEQSGRFANYGPPEAQRSTIAARLLAGDGSAGEGTPDQRAFVNKLGSFMGVPPAYGLPPLRLWGGGK